MSAGAHCAGGEEVCQQGGGDIVLRTGKVPPEELCQQLRLRRKTIISLLLHQTVTVLVAFFYVLGGTHNIALRT